MPRDQKEPKVSKADIVAYVKRYGKVTTLQVAEMFRLSPDAAKDRLLKIKEVHKVGLNNHTNIWSLKESNGTSGT